MTVEAPDSSQATQEILIVKNRLKPAGSIKKWTPTKERSLLCLAIIS
jgi:hypothetical protein